MYKRPIAGELHKRLGEPRRFIQVLAGPRQTGKTTLVTQVLKDLKAAGHYASADAPTLKSPVWIEQQWEMGRNLARNGKGVLVLDEIQKIPGWSEIVKKLWDNDTLHHVPLHVVLLGSSTILVQKGLQESLAGRFEIIPVTHWSFAEMRTAFDFSLTDYIYYGGYPGAATLISEPDRWRQYILDSLIETTISRDILLMTRVDKPALLRQMFELGCVYSGQILSFHKMTGQLQEAGNTTTLAHYLGLLRDAGLISGLSKYSGKVIRQRASSPKLVVHNTALMAAFHHQSIEQASKDPVVWGRFVESAVGAHLINETRNKNIHVFYWNDNHSEVDFVLQNGQELIAIEVKSHTKETSLIGMAAFGNQYPGSKKLLVGGSGIAIKDFLSSPLHEWL